MKISKRRGGRRWLCLLAAVVLLGGYGWWAFSRPLPLLRPLPGQSQLPAQTTAAKLSWPAAGQSAVGIAGTSILETHGAQVPVPTASTAKLITALTVLRAKPLALGEQGPVITLGTTDVANYSSYLARGGSVVKVTAGEQISEYQILETMMLPSANNMADSLATWAFGSLAVYSAAANSYIAQLGLTQTHVGIVDASGFDPSTTSTARDLVRLGELAMQNPVLAQIVGQATASGIPVAGTVKNVNFLLGTDNIVGVKTGNTDQAGGVFISAARTTANDKPVTVITALAGAPTLFDAVQDSLPLIQSAQAGFKPTSIISAGAVVGHYQQPWGGSIAAVAGQNLSLDTWNGNITASTVRLRPAPATTRAGQTVGSLITPQSSLAVQQSLPVKLQADPTKPPLWWRLTHPLR